jgi:hypothetical protein
MIDPLAEAAAAEAAANPAPTITDPPSKTDSIRELGRAGARVEDIADDLGVPVKVVLLTLKQAGITPNIREQENLPTSAQAAVEAQRAQAEHASSAPRPGPTAAGQGRGKDGRAMPASAEEKAAIYADLQALEEKHGRSLSSMTNIYYAIKKAERGSS